MPAALDVEELTDDGGSEDEELGGERSRNHKQKISDNEAEFNAKIKAVADRNRRPGHDDTVTIRHVDPATLRKTAAPRPVKVTGRETPRPNLPLRFAPMSTTPNDVVIEARRRDDRVVELLRERARSCVAIAHELDISKALVGKALKRLQRRGAAEPTEHAAYDFVRTSNVGRASRVWKAKDGPDWVEAAAPAPAFARVPIEAGEQVTSAKVEAPEPDPAPQVEQLPDVRTTYRDLLFAHALVHPEHEHIFDRLERLLGL